MTFDEAHDLLIGHEKGYSNHPKDPGGETMYGVTQRVARRWGYKGSMKDLPFRTAKEIARKEYWDAVRADELPLALRFDVFDGAYHSGPTQSIKWLQRAAGVNADGKLGPVTLRAIYATDGWRIAARYNGRRLDFLNDNLNKWKAFGRGWAQRIAENLMRL